MCIVSTIYVCSYKYENIEEEFLKIKQKIYEKFKECIIYLIINNSISIDDISNYKINANDIDLREYVLNDQLVALKFYTIILEEIKKNEIEMLKK